MGIISAIRMATSIKTADPQFRSILAALSIMTLDSFAVFFNGAYFIGPLTLCAVGAWVVLAATSHTNLQDLLPLSGLESGALLSMAALWLWSGASIVWSIAADLAWVEFNRSGAYLAVFAIGLFVGRQKKASVLSAWFFLGLVVVTSYYALGVKMFPGVIVNPDDLARTALPLGYTNALGLLSALAVPLALYMAAINRYAWLPRILAAAAIPMLFTSLFFTLSRGAMLALAIGLMIYFVLVPLRLRSFFLLLLSMAATMPMLIWSSNQDALMQDKIDLGLRIAAAAQLRVCVLLAVMAVSAVFGLALLLGGRVRFPPWAARVAGIVIISILLISLTTGFLLFANSQPSFSGWARDTYREMTVGSPQETGAARLFEFGLSSRWKIWEEAIANWQEHPLAGTGAQSFPLVHLALRQSGSLFVKNPHGILFQLVTELGLIGLLFGAMFIVTGLTGSMLSFCRVSDRWEKGLLGTFISMSFIYLIHTSYDWDWNIPALTMPFFFFTGITMGWRRAVR